MSTWVQSITTAELPVAHYPEIDEPGFLPDCRICADACPVGAILIEERRVRIMTCLGHTARTPQMSQLRFFLLSKLRPESAARYMSLRASHEHRCDVCSECVAFCPYGDGDFS